MTLRSHLLLLTLAVLLPVALFAIVISFFLVHSERETFRRGAEERTLAILAAVDAQISGHITAIEALSASPSLDVEDLDIFRRYAARILPTQPAWTTLNLALPSGQQVLNLLRPPGAGLPAIPMEDSSVARVARTGRPVVGDLVLGPLTQKWDFAVRAPIIRDDRLRYILSAVIDPNSIQQLLKTQELPADWVGVVLDRNERIVARSVNPEESVGKLASQSLRDALARAPSGWFHGSTIEGTVVYTPYRRSELTGWVFAMGIPAYAVEDVAMQTRWTLAFGLMAAFGAALALAALLGRRIARPIQSLAAATRALGHGEQIRLPEAGPVTEVSALTETLREAAQAVRERQALIERESKALKTLDRNKDQFLAMLSHELRTPLASLTTAAHILRVAGPAHEAARQARDVIERQTRQMTRLIEDLLDISRVTMGKATLYREALDLGALVANVIAAWRVAGRFDAHALKLTQSVAWVNADRARAEQIVSNLLDNALKFTPAGGAIEVSVTADGSDAVLEVRDNGEGLASNFIDHAFDLFTQGERGLDRRKGGLGIGLALVKHLAEMHGGRVSAASAGPGQGSTFSVRLPSIAALGEKAAPMVAADDEDESLPRRVLIIEDNEDARHMLRAALQLSGHEVRVARDGASGLAAALEARPDIALIDIGLPDIDGYEIARRLRADPRNGHITLIALSGYGQPGDLQRAYDAGFDVHLTKPVEPELLNNVIAGLR